MALELGTVIASRELVLADGGRVTVQIGAPFPPPDYEGEYWCPYKISGLVSVRLRRVVGIDAIQALMLALQAIGTDLYSSEEYRAGRLSWFENDRSATLGFPVLEGFDDLLPDEQGEPKLGWPKAGDRSSDLSEEDGKHSP